MRRPPPLDETPALLQDLPLAAARVPGLAARAPEREGLLAGPPAGCLRAAPSVRGAGRRGHAQAHHAISSYTPRYNTTIKHN